MMKVLEELQKDYYLDIKEINVREDRTYVERYKASFTPFLVLFDEGENEIFQIEGTMTKEDILRAYELHGEILQKRKDGD